MPKSMQILRGLNGQQINHQIQLKIQDMIRLAKNYYLKKEQIHIFYLLNFSIFFIFLQRTLLLKDNNYNSLKMATTIEPF